MKNEEVTPNSPVSQETENVVFSPAEATILGLAEIDKILDKLHENTVIHPTSYNMTEDLMPLPLTTQGLLATAYLVKKINQLAISPLVITTGGWERKEQEEVTVSEISARELYKLLAAMGIESDQYQLLSEKALLVNEMMVPHTFHSNSCSRELSEECNVAFDLSVASYKVNVKTGLITIVSPMHCQRALLAYRNRSKVYRQNPVYYEGQLPNYTVLPTWSVLMHEMGFRIVNNVVTIPEQFIEHFSALVEIAGFTEMEALKYMIENGLIFDVDITNKVFELYKQERVKMLLTQIDPLLPQLLVSTPLANKKEKSYTG